PAAAGPHEADELALGDRDRDVVERVDVAPRRAERLLHVLDRELLGRDLLGLVAERRHRGATSRSRGTTSSRKPTPRAAATNASKSACAIASSKRRRPQARERI